MTEAAVLVGGPADGRLVQLEHPVDFYEVHVLPPISPSLKRHGMIPHTVTVKRHTYVRGERRASGYRAYHYQEPA